VWFGGESAFMLGYDGSIMKSRTRLFLFPVAGKKAVSTTGIFHFSMPGRETGFSLVELMISLTLGLFLSLMVIQSYLTSVRVDKTILGQTEIQENARFSLQVLEKSIQQAGYFPNVSGDRAEFFLAQNDSWPPTVFTTGDALLGFDDSNAPVPNQPSAKKGTDLLFMRFVTAKTSAGENSDWTDCNGVKLAPETTVLMGFYVSNDAALMCRSLSQGGSINAPPQPLISNVKNFQLFYGIDVANDGAVDRYVSAQDVAGLGGWERVSSVQLRLELADSLDSIQTKVFEKTIPLRNI
jgi:type IV pilus assembly protein PilW